MKWIRTQPRFDGFLVKMNNEGARTEAQGWNLKMMGMEPGASDLFLAYPVGRFHGLWLEVKRNRKYTPSEMATESWRRQKAFLERMILVGFDGHFCYGWEDGMRIIKNYLLSPPA